MKPSKAFKIIIGVFILAGIAAILIWGFLESRKELAIEQERERPIKAPLRVSAEDGESVVTLDTATLIKSGIEAAPLTPASHKMEARAYGTVLEVQEMVNLYKNYTEAKAMMEKAKATLDASGKEYERLKKLNADNKNISDKALQSAESILRSDEAALNAAQATLRSIENTAIQGWGKTVAKWIIEGSAPYQRLASLQDVLILITIPADEVMPQIPEKVRVQAPNGKTAEANLISPSPHTDPRIQGLSYLYIIHDRPAELIPGMNLTAFLPVGAEIRGVFIPDSAVVWWQGKSWVYLQKDYTRFVRREFPTDTPLKDGWFVYRGFAAKDRLVVRGAQMLLSEELRSQIQVGEEKEQ